MTTKISRRELLQRGAALSASSAAMPWLLGLSAMQEAAAATSSDYKALVCVFLDGGNDHANTVIPLDGPNYSVYKTVRDPAGLAEPVGSILPLTPTTSLTGTGREYGLSPKLPKLQKRFNVNKTLAVVLNVGTLVEPIADSAVLALPETRLPPKLYSHNDQRSIWQSGGAEGTAIGWGGRFIDEACGAKPDDFLSCINASLTSVLLSGNRARQYQATVDGAVLLNGQPQLFGSTLCGAALKKLMTQPFKQPNRDEPHPFKRIYTDISARALVEGARLQAQIDQADPVADMIDPEAPLMEQLRLVARAISRAQDLGLKRQVFMVTLRGFDTHSAQRDSHASLLAQLDDALEAFYVNLGRKALGNVQSKVTTFTASDFGRALRPNEDGTDHGWGSTHFVLGPVVKGGEFYGTPPEITLDDTGAISGAQNAGNGRLIPTTSVVEYAATLGHWFGVPQAKLDEIFPTLQNFSAKAPPYLDFFKNPNPSCPVG